MKPETFVKLAIAAGIACIVALITHSSGNRWSQDAVAGAKLAPQLASGKAQVASLTVEQAGTTLTLQAKDKLWSIKERSGYPADTEKVRALLVKLAQAELIEPKTRKPDRYALLELEDPKAKDAKSRSLRITDPKGAALADLVVGKQRSDAFGTGKVGTYVRKPGDPQTWLANAEITAPTDIRAWIKPSILETEDGKISNLVIEIPGEEPLRIERGEAADAKPAFAGLPESKKLKDASAAEGVVRAAALIEADDVRRAAATAATGASMVKLDTKDGLSLELRIMKDGEARWLSIAASGKTEAGKKAADAIKARTEGWEFKISAAKAEQLLKRRAELLESS